MKPSNLTEKFAECLSENDMIGEVRGWALLGISSLALAGIFAVALALSRVPGIENSFPWPLGFFEKGLVIHVVFSFVVWFLAVFGVFLTVMTTLSPNILLKGFGPQAVWAGVIGVILLAVPGFLDRSEASLNNYVPVIIDPLYYSGLVIFAAALGLVVLRFLANARRAAKGWGINHTDYIEMAVASSFIIVAALACFLLAYLPRIGDVIDARFNEDVFWGGGHALQFLNTFLMLSGWYLLAHQFLGKRPVKPLVLRTVVILCVVPPALMPLLYAFFSPDSGALVYIFTDLQYLLAPPVAVMGGAILLSLKDHLAGRKLPFDDIAFLCLFLSCMTFAIGGFLGLFVDGADTRTPAHYHAVIAAINIVFMGMFLNFVLPIIGRAIDLSRKCRVLVWLYAVGQMVASIGLFLAGGYGVPRKTAGGEQGLEAIGAKIGLYMNGVGAAIAVIGGIMFIWICARALLRKQNRIQS